MAIVLLDEPVWGDSQLVEDDCSSLVSSGVTPYVLTGILIRLLRYHFADSNNISIESLRGLTWKEDCAESSMHIGAGYEFTPGVVQQRPAIYVKREAVSSKQVGLLKGDSTVTALNQITGLFEGSKHQKQLQGVFSLICVGTLGLEAELIGEEVYYRMLHFAPKIQDDIRVSSFRVRSLSEIKTIKNTPGQLYYTVVAIDWNLIHRWRIVPIAPVLKRTHLGYTVFGEDFQ